MKINEADFHSFVSIKQGLATQSIRHCDIRIGVINRWFIDKELTKENVEKFFFELKARGRKNNTLNSYYFVFRQLKEYCQDRELSSDFFNGFKSFKKIKTPIDVFTSEEIEKLLNTPLTYGKQNGKDCSFLDFRYRTLNMFLALTGCREGEAFCLKIKRLDISAGKATFVNTKNNENRCVYFTEPLKSYLKELIDGKIQTIMFLEILMRNKFIPKIIALI